MTITEVRIKLMENGHREERLAAFCTITLDGNFVVRDLKVIEGAKGPFIAFPSRKLTDRCPKCGTKNHLRAGYCNDCGERLNKDRATCDADGRIHLYTDIAHPISQTRRAEIQEAVLRAYREEVGRAKLPDYVSTYDEYDN